MTPKDQAEVARRLATWFEGAQRDLAWRRTRDPYAIWVSEVMLQQTRVETVEVYWPAFLRRFPTVQALADADEQAVLEAWSGLGYYRRARFLHKGARYVVDQLGGELPADEAGLRAIPGVGPYTAGAIGSIAFDQPIALVDGNVARVLSRLDAITDPKQQDAAAKHHWKRVGELLTHAPPRVLAQALMELGATVCTPKNPRCEDCPVRKHCVAKRRGLEREIPAPKQKNAHPSLTSSRWLSRGESSCCSSGERRRDCWRRCGVQCCSSSPGRPSTASKTECGRRRSRVCTWT